MRTALATAGLLLLASLIGHGAAQETAAPVLAWDITTPIAEAVPLQTTMYTAVLVVKCAPGSIPQNPWSVHVQVTPPPAGWSVSVAPQTFHVTPEGSACMQGQEVVREPIEVSLSPTLEPAAGTVAAFTLLATEQQSGAEASAQLDVPVGPLVRAQLQFDQTTFKAAPGATITVPLAVTNVGNAPLRVIVERSPYAANELSVTWPDDLVVNTTTKHTYKVVVTMPEGNGVYVKERHHLALNTTTEWTEDGAVKGEHSVQLTAVFLVQGVTGAAAGPGLLLVALLMVTGLAIMRRRHQHRR